MSDRRPAQTIGELDIHLGFVMDELRDMRGTLDRLATKEWVSTKIADLELKIEANTPRSVWKRITEMAVGVTALAAMLGVVVAIVKWTKL